MKLHLPKVLLMALMTTFVGLSPYAAGETVEINTLNSGDGVWYVNNGTTTTNTLAGITNTKVCYTYNITNGITATYDTALTFSLTMKVQRSCWTAEQDFYAGVTFGGSMGAFAVGKLDYKNTTSFGYISGGDGTTEAFHLSASVANLTTVTGKTGYQEIVNPTPLNTNITIDGTLASDGDGTYTLTLTYGNNSHAIDMGINDDINRISFYAHGSNRAEVTALTLIGEAAEAVTYTWAGTPDNNTWSAANGGIWSSGAARTTKRDTVTFVEHGETKSVIVTIDDTVVARDLIVEDNYTFQGSTASDNVTAVNDLSIAAGKTLQLSGEGTLNATTVSGEGALVLSDGSRWTTASAAVLDAVTGTGDVAISGFMNLVDGQSISSTGKVIIGSGSELRLGLAGSAAAHAETYNIGLDNSGFELAGGQLSARGFADNLGDINVTENSIIWLVDINLRGEHENDKTSIGTLTVNKNKNLDLDTHWKGRIEVAKLTGAGNVTFGSSSDDSSGRHLTVNSVEGYTGHLTIEERANNPARLNLTVGEGETFKASQLTACNTSTVVIDGAGTYEMGNQLYIAKAGEAEKGSFATTWTGTTSFSGAEFNGTDLNQYGNANSTVKLYQTSGSLAADSNGISTIKTNIDLVYNKDYSGLDLTDSSSVNIIFEGKVSGTGNLALGKNLPARSITFTNDVSDWTGILWASSTSTITFKGDANMVKNSDIVASNGNTSSLIFENSNDGLTVDSGLNNNYWANGTLNVTVKNTDNATGAVTFNKATSSGSATTNLLVDSGASAVFTHAETKFNKIEVKSDAHLSFTNEDKQANVASATFDGGILETKTQALKVSGATTVTAQGATLKGSLEAVGGVQLKDSSDTLAASISGIETNTNATLTNVTLSNTGIGAVAGTQGSIENALVELQQNSSFSITDVTMSNVEISAAEVSTPVLLQPVKATYVSLTKGTFMSEGDVEKTESGSTPYAYSTDALSGITLNNEAQTANIVLNLGGMGDFAQNATGICDISITLTDFSVKAVDIKGIYFAADSWLGQLLAAQGADAYVKDSILSVAQVYNLTDSAAGSTNVSVSFETSGDDTVITITGLDMVPEPTTTTLSLLALTALAARRRRR